MNIYFLSQGLLTVIFFVISTFHFYWFAGGRAGKNMVVPESEPNKAVFNPSRIGTLVVALGLLFLCLLAFERLEIIETRLVPIQIANYITRLFVFIFTLRAVGEFNYIGFFAKKRDTKFSYWDKRVFSPLCLLLAILLVFER